MHIVNLAYLRPQTWVSQDFAQPCLLLRLIVFARAPASVISPLVSTFGLSAEALDDFFPSYSMLQQGPNSPSAARAGSAVWSLTTWRAELARTPDLPPFGLCSLMSLAS